MSGCKHCLPTIFYLSDGEFLRPESIENLTAVPSVMDNTITVSWEDSTNSNFNLSYIIAWRAVASNVIISSGNRTLNDSVLIYNITGEFVQDGVVVYISVQPCNDFGLGPRTNEQIVLPGGKITVCVLAAATARNCSNSRVRLGVQMQ